MWYVLFPKWSVQAILRSKKHIIANFENQNGLGLVYIYYVPRAVHLQKGFWDLGSYNIKV